MIDGIDHIVVLVGDIGAAAAAYQALFGRAPKSTLERRTNHVALEPHRLGLGEQVGEQAASFLMVGAVKVENGAADEGLASKRAAGSAGRMLQHLVHLGIGQLGLGQVDRLRGPGEPGRQRPRRARFIHHPEIIPK